MVSFNSFYCIPFISTSYQKYRLKNSFQFFLLYSGWVDPTEFQNLTNTTFNSFYCILGARSGFKPLAISKLSILSIVFGSGARARGHDHG